MAAPNPSSWHQPRPLGAHGEEMSDGQRTQEVKPKSAAFTAVKQELLDPTPRPGETEREAKVRVMTERIRAEAKRAREGAEAKAPQAEQQALPPPAKKKMLDPAAERKREEDDATKIEKMLPVLEEKVTAAEDEAEKVAILAAPLSMEASEELKELQLGAIRETERAVKAAMGNVVVARRELDKRKAEAENFAPIAKDTASDELSKLTLRLDAAQSRLDEHKNVRKDHELAIAAEKLFGELATKLVSVEIDCEKASMMAEPLAKILDTNPQEINATEVRETKEALRVAQATLAPTMRLISGKISGLKGNVRNKMLELQARAEAAQAMLDKAQKTVEESQSRAAALPLLKQAAERVAKVEEVLHKMRETEAPFLMGIETMPPEETAEVLTKMDKAAALAQSALADAHKYIALKMVEVGRLAEGAAESARQEMEKVKQQLDAGMERIRRFQNESAKRRRVNLVEVVKHKVEDADSAILKMKEVGAELQNAESSALTDVLEKAHAAEVEAQNAVTLARRELQDKQQDLRPMEGGQQPEALKTSSEILRTKVRVNYMEAELNKFRKMAKDFEEKIKVEKSLTDIADSLKDAEAEVERLSTASQTWPKDAQVPEEEEKNISNVQGKLSSTTVQVEMKLQNAQGLELKELRGVFGRLQRVQWKLDRVKEASRERSRHLSAKIVRDAAEAVQKAEGKVSTVSSNAASLTELSVTRLESLTEQAGAALQSVAEAQQALAKGQGPQLMLEAKVEFARLQLRCKAAERRCKAAADSLNNHFDSIAQEATQQALQALRSVARREDGTYDPDKLFTELSDTGNEITELKFCEFFAKNKGGVALSADKVQLAFKRIAPHGLTQRIFAAALADFIKVVRDITITDDFEIQSAKKIRKLEIGEVLEALGASKEDESLGLERVQCRAIRDGCTGWVTVQSSAGTLYLERAQKPFLWCQMSLDMKSAPDSNSAKVRELKAGEVVELVEGPREERLGSDMRVRGVTCADEATGWLQIRDKSGTIQAKLCNSVYKCMEAIAMTDLDDFEHCTMVRRIDGGEALELLPDKEVSPSEGGARRKFRACRDGREGWVTTQGSGGTIYVKVAPKHYICQQATPVHAGLSAESAVVRVLMPGEAFAAFEDPKEVAGGERLTLYKVRSVIDGAGGWVTSTQEEVRPWTARYKVLKTVALTRTLAANEAAEVIEVVRLLEPNELVDAAEHPTEDPSTGQLRVRCVAISDKTMGWATVREGSGGGPLLLRPATPEDEASVPPADIGMAAPSTPPAAAQTATSGIKRPTVSAGKGKGGSIYQSGAKRYKGKGGW